MACVALFLQNQPNVCPWGVRALYAKKCNAVLHKCNPRFHFTPYEIQMAKVYWIGIIGTADEFSVPETFAQQMRTAIRRAWVKVTRQPVGKLVGVWGCGQTQTKIIQALAALPPDDLAIEHVEHILKTKYKL